MPHDVIEVLHKANQLLQASQWERRLYTNVLNESAQAPTDVLEENVMMHQTDSMRSLNDCVTRQTYSCSTLNNSTRYDKTFITTLQQSAIQSQLIAFEKDNPVET